MGNRVNVCNESNFLLPLLPMLPLLPLLLNQARAWFLEIVFVKTSVCVCVCFCVCVSAPQAIKNYSREMKPE